MNAFLYLKALHIIFVCTWFAGLFYIIRLFIYYIEASERPKHEAEILQPQFSIMIKRLWKIITVPSAILTLILGMSVWYCYGTTPDWLLLKLGFVCLLYGYHLYSAYIMRKLLSGEYIFSSNQLRVWNEGATILLFAIVFLVVVKSLLSPIYGILGLIVLGITLMLGIRLYKKYRENK